MKVSERIAELRELLRRDGYNQFDDWYETEYLITQLEVDVVVALQTARFEGYEAGYNRRAELQT